MDTGTSNVQIYGNFINGGTVGGIYLSGGANNQVWNNIVTGTQQAAGGGLGYGILLGGLANTTPMVNNQVHNNIIQVPAGASAISFQNGIITPSEIYANIYYNSSGVPLRIANMTLSQWQALGGDKGSTSVADPGFTNAANKDFSLIPGSYALTHGFQDLPSAKMALAGVQGQAGITAGPGAPAIIAFSTDSGTAGDGIANTVGLVLILIVLFVALCCAISMVRRRDKAV